MRNPHYPRLLTPKWFSYQWDCFTWKNPNLQEDWVYGQVLGARLRNCLFGLKIMIKSLLGYKFLGWKKTYDY